MARSSYSAGKRQREREKAKKKKEKLERARQRDHGSSIPIATVDELQGGMRSIEEVMGSLTGEEPEDKQRATVPGRLFVGGLNWRTTNDELQKTFEKYGAVSDVHIVTDRETGDSRGFGFVTMANHKDMAAAIRGVNGSEVDGRTLVVKKATART